MESRTDASLIPLAMGQVITLDDAAGTRVHSRCGTLWVTEEDDPRDHIVSPGEDFMLARGGRTVIQALQPAWLFLQ